MALEQYRDEGYLAGDGQLPDDARLGAAGDTEIVPWSRIEEEFRLEDVNQSPAFFDLKKLRAFNGEYIRALPRRGVRRRLRRRGCRRSTTGRRVRRDGAARPDPRVTLAEASPMVDFLFLADPVIDEGAWAKAMKPPRPRGARPTAVAAFESVVGRRDAEGRAWRRSATATA